MFEFGDVKLQTEMFILLLWVGSRYHLDQANKYFFCIIIVLLSQLEFWYHAIAMSLNVLLVTRCNRMVVSHVAHCYAVNLTT